MKRPRGRRGFTMVELMIGGFLALIVLLAMGRLVLANQRSWEWGRDKLLLQQNITEALEAMARAVRAADSLAVTNASDFSTFDDGALVHRFARATIDGVDRLQQDDVDLVDRRCVSFLVTPNVDTTNVVLQLELEDEHGSRMVLMTVATPRNRSFVF